MKKNYLSAIIILFISLVLFSFPSLALIPGDFNEDGCVEFEDLMIFALAYGTCEGDDNWDLRCDIYSDGCIEFEDLMVFAMHYGEHENWEVTYRTETFAPGDNAVRILWNDHIDADDYQVYKSTDGVTFNILEGTYELHGDWYEFWDDGTIDGNTYYYYVKALDGITELETSATMTVNTWLPGIVVLDPIEDEVITNPTPTFTWEYESSISFPAGPFSFSQAGMNLYDIDSDQTIWEIPLNDLNNFSYTYDGPSLTLGHHYIWCRYIEGEGGNGIMTATAGRGEFSYNSIQDSGIKVFLESGGTLNGVSINPPDPVLTVNSGESITGTLKVQAIYSGPSGNVVPFGYTPSWGSHSSSYVTVVSDLPVGTSPYDVSIDLNAPTTPGTYYLIFASNAEMNLGWTMSQTNWTTGTMSWDDGNDIADLTEPELQNSISTGFLYLDMLVGSTYNKSNYGIAYVKINVGTITDYDFYNIYHEAELEGDYVVRDGYKIKVIAVYSDGRVTYEINDGVNVTLDPGQFYDEYDGGKLIIYHEFGDTDVNKVASWQTWTVNLNQNTITPDNLQVTQGQQDAYYVIQTPGNNPYNIGPAKVTSDGEYIANNWDDSWSTSTIDSTHYKALIDIPTDAPIKTYNFWLKYMHSGTGDCFVQKVQLTVELGAPDTRIIRLEGDLNFGSVQVGTTSQKTLTIYNDGNSTLTVTNIDYPTDFSGDWSGDIPAEGHHDVNVTFAPTQAIPYNGTLTVNSNKTSGTNTKSVSGNGTEIPTVTTQDATNIETHSVIANGTITSDGGSKIIEKGFEYGLTQTPTWSVKETGTDLSTGTFSNTISDLDSDTTYWVKAYAVNSEGKSTNEDWQEFHTPPDIIITNSATFTCDGQQAVTSDCDITLSY